MRHSPDHTGKSRSFIDGLEKVGVSISLRPGVRV